MNLFDKLATILGSEKKGTIVSWAELDERDKKISELGIAAFTNKRNWEPERTDTKAYLESANSWVYACSYAIADEIAKIKIRLYKRESELESKEVNKHPILDLVYGVNPFTTKFDHFWLTQLYLELAGEAPWLVSRGENGKPNALFLLRPDKLKINYDEKTIIGGYTYELGGGETMSIKREDIIFIKYPDPVKQFRGRGTLAAAKETYAIDRYSEQWNLTFFKNQARPDAILTTEQRLTQEQLERLRKDWEKKYQGREKHGQMAILGGGLKYNILQLSQKDMEFLDQQRFSRDKILAIFRVPKPIVSVTEDVNRSNADVAAYTFARWTISPKMTRIVEFLNEFLIPMFDDTGDLYFDFDDPVPENLDLKIKEYKAALGPSGWLTINEVRAYENLPPVEGGDALYRPMTELPVAGEDDKRPLGLLGEEVPEEEDDEEGVQEEDDEKEEEDEKEKPKKSSGNMMALPVMKGVKVKKKYPSEFFTLNARKNKDANNLSNIEQDIKDIIKKDLLENKYNNGNNKNDKEDIVKVEKKIVKENKKEELKVKKGFVKNKRDFWEKQIEIEEEYEEIVKKKMQSIFREQEEDVLKRLKTESNRSLGKANREDGQENKKYRFSQELKKNIINILIDVSAENKKFKKIFVPTFLSLIGDIGEYIFRYLNFGGKFNDKDEMVKNFLDAHVIKFADSVNKDTNKQIRRVLSEGIGAGEGVPQLSTRIKDVFGRASENRSLMIARTETSRAVNFATVESYRQSGVVDGKEWLTAFDERTCEACEAMNGKILSLGEDYFKKGDKFKGISLDYSDIGQPPLHCRCRCTVIPVILE